MMRARAEIARYAAGNNADPPQRLGSRYDAMRFLPEAGNTVVCHLDFDDPGHQAVLDARRRMQSLPEAEKFLYTPVASLHMTVFEGVIETRRTPDAWPANLDRNDTVDNVTEVLASRLADFTPPPSFTVCVEDIRPTGLILKGATDEDDTNMRAWREALTKPFGFRHGQHDTYRFHMTFAYPIDWISDAHIPEWEAEFSAVLADLKQAAPIIPLNPAAFCQFEDMTEFRKVLVVGAE